MNQTKQHSEMAQKALRKLDKHDIKTVMVITLIMVCIATPLFISEYTIAAHRLLHVIAALYVIYTVFFANFWTQY